MQERRQFVRIKKSITCKYAIALKPETKGDISKILDVSQGGVKFFAYGQFKVGDILFLDFIFPMNYPQETRIKGRVLDVSDVKKDVTSYVRVQFVDISPDALKLLIQFEKINIKK